MNKLKVLFMMIVVLLVVGCTTTAPEPVQQEPEVKIQVQDIPEPTLPPELVKDQPKVKPPEPEPEVDVQELARVEKKYEPYRIRKDAVLSKEVIDELKDMGITLMNEDEEKTIEIEGETHRIKIRRIYSDESVDIIVDNKGYNGLTKGSEKVVGGDTKIVIKDVLYHFPVETRDTVTRRTVVLIAFE